MNKINSYKQGSFPTCIESIICDTKIGRLNSGDICYNENGTIVKIIPTSNNEIRKKVELTQEEINACYILKTGFEMEIRNKLIDIQKQLNSITNILTNIL